MPDGWDTFCRCLCQRRAGAAEAHAGTAQHPTPPAWRRRRRPVAQRLLAVQKSGVVWSRLSEATCGALLQVLAKLLHERTAVGRILPWLQDLALPGSPVKVRPSPHWPGNTSRRETRHWLYRFLTRPCAPCMPRFEPSPRQKTSFWAARWAKTRKRVRGENGSRLDCTATLAAFLCRCRSSSGGWRRSTSCFVEWQAGRG